MFYGISHIDVPVTDLERSRRLYTDVLGFRMKKEGRGWIDVDTGTVLLRLLEVRRPEHRVSLRVHAPDVVAALKILIAAGARPLYDAMRTDDLELMGAVVDFDGHTIVVQRDLTEDEYGFIPELPTELTWGGDADGLLKTLLQAVPALFRGLARRKVVRNAEYLARERRGPAVNVDDVVRAYIISSAKVTRYRAKQPLIDQGFDPANYRDEFES